MGTTTNQKVLHDLLLSVKPADAAHDECPLCAVDQEGEVSTYTEDELKDAIAKAVAEAVSAKDARIVELETAQQSDELTKAVADATAELTAKVETLEAALEAQAVEKKTAEDNLAALQATIDEENESKRRQELRDSRVDAVKALDIFDDAFIDARADGWAELDEPAFAARFEEWEAVAAAKGEPPAGHTSTVPKATAMTATREPATTPTPSARTHASEVIRLRQSGVDLRTVI